MKAPLLLMLVLVVAGCQPKGTEPASVAGGDSTSPVIEGSTANAAESSDPDFGDYSSSYLTTKAWESLAKKDLGLTLAYTNECITRYLSEAVEMQEALTEPVSTDDKEAVLSKWALNDVGTCYFIQGQAYEADGKAAEAMEAYQTLLDKVAFAQCWDNNGWFWKPADAAAKQAKMLEFELLDAE
ncbi:hypothetical protein SAMN06265222_11052 [Neorhodopirellula lusitana]|uniref:Uncharacterized protein n=1 Tax=Neorhodopirellula lusitana TaxID=445327 RepID=A0ABY1QFE5_9BACT|nr:beta-glucanase precursor [Neorhodopirellula lusitana]SMP66854.1 hypothetical protein SAMN06265222_11052 [Neorhodopirellula lusitana]